MSVEVKIPRIVKVIQSLRPGADFAIDVNPDGSFNNFRWLDKVQTRPTLQEIQDAVANWVDPPPPTDEERLIDLLGGIPRERLKAALLKILT